MINYEILVIFDSTLNDETIENKLSILKGWIEKFNGKVQKVEDKGIEKLTYEINKTAQGHFVLVEFILEPSKIEDLRREIKLEETIWRYMIKKNDEVKV